MNQAEFWVNGPPAHNILLYNANEFNENDFTDLIYKTVPKIVILYNLYGEKDDVVKLFEYEYFFYIDPVSENIKDPGILILSEYPVLIYSNKKIKSLFKRSAREISFSIMTYQFVISMNPDIENDGYTIKMKYVPTTDPIIHTSKTLTNKFTLLKSK